jgi:hypothetical protein
VTAASGKLARPGEPVAGRAALQDPDHEGPGQLELVRGPEARSEGLTDSERCAIGHGACIGPGRA